MTKQSMATLMLSMAAGLVLTACGGSSSGSSTASQASQNTTHYNLSQLVYASIRAQMTGVFNGAPSQGEFYSHYTGDLVYNGIPLSVRENVLTLGTFSESDHKGYYQGAHFGTKFGPSRVCTLPDASQLTPPNDVTVGYHVSLAFQCTDGSTMEIAKSLIDGGNQQAVFVDTAVLHTASGDTTTTEKWTLSPQSEVVAYERTEQSPSFNYALHSTQTINE